MLDQPETLINSEIGQRLCTFLQQWTSNLWEDSGRGNGSRNKLRTYRMFKQDFYLEPYLLQIKDSAMRRSLCCFRISCHPLQIERGRYHQPRPIPAGQWYCPLWHKRGRDAVEDETHFLFECNSYADERCLLFQSTAANLSSLFSSLNCGRAKICADKLRGPQL